MRPFFKILLVISCLALPSLGRAQPAILSTETVLTDPLHQPGWSDLFQHLSQPKNRISQFEERRYFPFREKPIVLTGEIRIIPERGLSLNYLTPKQQTVIVDETGVLLRDNQGRQRSAPADSRAQAATSALFSILRFDLATLQQQFVLHGVRTEHKWQLAFVPRDAALGGSLGTVTVEGEDQRLTRIDINRSDKQRIEILIRSSLEDVIFPVDVLKRFFR